MVRVFVLTSIAEEGKVSVILFNPDTEPVISKIFQPLIPDLDDLQKTSFQSTELPLALKIKFIDVAPVKFKFPDTLIAS